MDLKIGKIEQLTAKGERESILPVVPASSASLLSKIADLEQRLAMEQSDHQHTRNERDTLTVSEAALREELEKLISAAEKIRHWHNTGRNDEGTVISSKSFFGLHDSADAARIVLAQPRSAALARVKAATLRDLADRIEPDSYVCEVLRAEAERIEKGGLDE